MSRSRTQVLVFAGVALTVLLGVVAFASRGHEAPTGSGAQNRGVSQALANAMFTAWFIVMLIGAVALMWMLAQRRGQRDERSVRTRRMMFGFLILVVTILALSFGVRKINLGPGNGHGHAGPPGVGKVSGKPGKKHHHGASRIKNPTFEWPLAVAFVALTVGAVLTAFLRTKARRAKLVSEVEFVEEIRRVLDLTLDDLRREVDPRKAVIAAYARMERILAVHGLPRRPSEAPNEYLARVLTELRVTQSAVEPLTELFARAKFSHHDVDPEMKDDAIDALVELREQIRAIDDSLVEKPTLRLSDVPGGAR